MNMKSKNTNKFKDKSTVKDLLGSFYDCKAKWNESSNNYTGVCPWCLDDVEFLVYGGSLGYHMEKLMNEHQPLVKFCSNCMELVDLEWQENLEDETRIVKKHKDEPTE